MSGKEDTRNPEIQQIKKDRYIKRFSFYGFFKNLKFFEPYMLVIFINSGLNLIEIGFLLAIVEIIALIVEVPSGFIADRFGRKNTMLACFIFYIISFLFFSAGGFFIYMIAMIFFGLGDAFRTGTHKAIIFEYLDKKGWKSHKAFVYGRTRSTSLMGSSISSVISIIFILTIPADGFIFILTILPYIADFILVATYPSFTNQRIKNTSDDPEKKSEFGKNGKDKISIKKHVQIRKLIINSAFYDAMYKSIKDYIQPILAMLVLSTALLPLPGLNADDQLDVVLGVVYCFFYVLGAFASKNGYRILKSKMKRRSINDLLYTITTIMFIGIALFYAFNIPFGIIILYFGIYGIFNTRRPIILAQLDELLSKKHRATVLSVESLVKSLFVIILSILLGLLAEYLSIWILFLVLSGLLVIVNLLSRVPRDADNKN
ncbi:MAG: MFS transporter [Promethearchaeota archaeon]